MMFLHGNGERGNGREDLDWVMVHGPLYEAWIQKRDLPFIIIGPQLPMYGMDTISYIRDRQVEQIPKRLDEGVPERPQEFLTPQKMRPESMVTFFHDETMSPAGWDREEDDLMSMIETVIRDYNGDVDRVYLTGLSYGGEGTWYMASKHPKTWAAVCPIVAWPHPDLIKPIAQHQIPLWSFAGGRDGSSLRYYYTGMNLLEELGHKDVRFTVEMDMGHDVWRRVYAGEDVYMWLLSKKRKQ
ncbi:MAG: alpha/beta hydrolase [Saprospiraceae bacterium]|uniref:Alpha/beta hydrolase n=1 Tax=Candidatus Opimibacter skivensis TaxID=2982028 RepID=A0A9D7SWL9_9BACT|nr:alpha/beta hydrolase [Candidatus Opimibacter skivensis]